MISHDVKTQLLFIIHLEKSMSIWDLRFKEIIYNTLIETIAKTRVRKRERKRSTHF